jgi:hypothetical protein
LNIYKGGFGGFMSHISEESSLSKGIIIFEEGLAVHVNS